MELFVVGDSIEEGEQRGDSESNVKHSASFSRVFNIHVDYLAKKRKPRSMAGSWLKVVGISVPLLLLTECLGNQQQGAEDDEGHSD